MKTLGAAKFKAQFLSLIDDISQSKETIIVTKHGKPVVKVEPVENNENENIKPLAGKATYIGDIISPVNEKWEADE